MYSNNKSYSNSFDNSVTVTPIKTEDNSTQAYPTSRYIDGSVAAAATTTIQHAVSSPNSIYTSQQDASIQNPYPILTTNDSTAIITNSKVGSLGAIPKGRSGKSKNSIPRKPPPTVDNFWSNILNDLKSIDAVDSRHPCLPLARIKKIMKLDENAKMIAAEAPLLFAKACEIFIQELTMRAWLHTEENKRRTLQRTDIAQAIASYDQFDFLIDIVPREEIRFQPKSQKEDRTPQAPSQSTNPSSSPINQQSLPQTVQKTEPMDVSNVGTVVAPIELLGGAQNSQNQPQQVTQQVQIIQHPALQPQQMQYFITIPGQQPGQTQIVQQLQVQPNQLTNGLSPQIAGLNLVSQQPQQLILTTGPNGQLTATPATSTTVPQQQILLQSLAQQQQQQQQQQQVQQQSIQLLQQVLGPNGEITNVPITINANQLNMLRLQMQQQQQQSHNQQNQQPISQQVNILFNPSQTTTATVAQLPTHNQSNTITSFRPNC